MKRRDDDAVARVGSKQLGQFIHRDPGLAQDRAKCAAVDLPVIGNDRLRKRIVTPHDDVATVLPPDSEAEFLKRADNNRNRKPAGACSYGQQECIEMLLWHGKAIIFQRENIAFDRFTNVGDGGFPAVALGNAARKTWALGHPEPVLTGINDYLSHDGNITARPKSSTQRMHCLKW